MTTTEITTTAENIVKAIKSCLAERKKVCKTHPFADRSVYVEYESEFDRPSAKYLSYIRVGDKYFRNLGIEGDTRTEGDIRQITQKVIEGLNALKETRGYKNLVFNTREEMVGDGYYSRRKITYLDRIQNPDAPCKDFKAIQSFVKRYGGLNLPDFKLYSAHMGGKRGVLWGEEGDRYYLANKEKKCRVILAELRNARSTKDIVTCKYGEEDYIDPIDQKYSAYHEVECDGEKRNYLEITIKTPSGKVKYQQKIY